MTEKKLEPLQKICIDLLEQTKSSTDILLKEYSEFQKKKEAFEKEQGIVNFPIKENVIELNVGGKVFSTLKATLQKAEGTLLGAMFSGRYDPGPKDKDGRYFIDRPPGPFAQILNCLRTESKLKLPDDDEERAILVKEIRYYEMEDFFKEQLKEPSFIGTKLLDQKSISLLNQWTSSQSNWKLIYRGTKDGFGSNHFHSKCDGQGECIVVIQSTNKNIFGGYCPSGFTSRGNYYFNQSSFLFSLVNSLKNPMKIPNTGSSHSNTYSVYDASSYGPTWGGGHDLYICSNANNTTSSYSNLGHSYAVSGYTYGSTQIQQLLAGSYNFQVAEIEVFKKCDDDEEEEEEEEEEELE